MKNDYEIRSDHAVIFLNCKGKTIETKISIEALERAKEFKMTWYAYWIERRKTYIVSGNFPLVNGKRKRVLLSRWLMGKETELFVDHINHDTLDNRFDNLRYANNVLNGHNRSDANLCNKTTGFRGVHFDKRSKIFIAYITVAKKRMVLGYFDDFEKAKKAVKEKRKELVPEVYK